MADPYGDMIRGLLLARMNRPAMERARSGLFANLPKDSERAVDPFGENPFEDDGVIEELPPRRVAPTPLPADFYEEPVDPFNDPLERAMRETDAAAELIRRYRATAPDDEIFRRRRPVLD